MKLLFYDKFFDSLINLPKGIQKKVIDFQKKFRDNSKSSAIHLEPISTFKDKSLRSARIDQTYRAIIKAPETGDVFYLLWVDHHDKAYEWATNKVFQWNGETQAMQMFTAPEVEDKAVKAESELIAETFVSKIAVEKLLKIGVPDVLLPSVNMIDSFEDLEKAEQYLPADAFENLFYLLDGANIDQLILDVEEGKLEEASEDEQANSINNQRSFIELTDDAVFNEILESGLNKWKYYLHPSQRKLVDGHFKGSVKVSGGAGTGKTVAALHRLNYLTRQYPEKKILFTTYTNALTENLTGLVDDLEISKSNIVLKTIDKVVVDLINEFELLPDGYKVFEYNSVKSSFDLWEEIIAGELTTYSPEFLDKEFIEVILYNNVRSLQEYFRTSRVGRGKPISRRQRGDIWAFIEQFKILKESQNLYYKDELFNLLSDHLISNAIYPFEFGLVDELQDFSNVQLRLIRSLIKEKENDLFLVGDPLQGIYNRRLSFSGVGINVRGKRSKRLRINYRTTEEIKKLAVSVIQDCHYDNFDGEEEEKGGYVSLFHGKKPSYQIFKSKNEEVDFVQTLIERLIESGYLPQEIAVASRTKDGLKDIRNSLHQANIHYSDRESNKQNSREAVSLLTFHRIKGLEFKHVILVDVNHRTFPKLPYDFDQYSDEEQEGYLRNEKSLVYVAVSRAIESVTITGTGNSSSLIKI